MLSKIAWTIWALLPVAGLAYHFGPGQRGYIEDQARDVLEEAQRLEALADQAQAEAYHEHIAALTARKKAAASPSTENSLAAKDAATREDQAYRVAAQAWKQTADKLQEAQDLLSRCGSKRVSPVRIARDRAAIRAGSIADGVGDLENMLDELSDAGQTESALADQAREELATGYYYGARLMRNAGKPTAQWRAVAERSRQNFRYLAESSRQGGSDLKAEELQKNLELVLNLEQSAQQDLLARPLPKNSPRGGTEGLGERPGRSRRPPRTRDDARGAGGTGEIEGGW